MARNNFQTYLQLKAKELGADFVHFVDIAQLNKEQNKAYPTAILIGKVLSKEYLKQVANVSNYVERMKISGTIKTDEFYLTELKTDHIADKIETYLTSKGYDAYSQSEENILGTGDYDKENKITPLPHKTIAGLAGLGWIGKHNLLVNPEYGSAISMCSVLTNAPLETVLHKASKSKCGDCNICEIHCKPKAIKGTSWEFGISRDKIIDVFLCKPCYQCVVQCPWTQKYMNR